MAKRLIISKRAYLDIERITEFNNKRNRSNTYSKKFVRNIFKLFKVLIKQPALGMRTNIEGVSLLVWDNYYIFYSVQKTMIWSLHRYTTKAKMLNINSDICLVSKGLIEQRSDQW